MIGAVIEFDFFYVLDPGKLVSNGSGLIERNIPHNNLSRIVSNKFPVHDVKAKPGLRVSRQKVLKTVIGNDKRTCVHADKCEDNEHDQNQLSSVDNILRDMRHQVFLAFHLFI